MVEMPFDVLAVTASGGELTAIGGFIVTLAAVVVGALRFGFVDRKTVKIGEQQGAAKIYDDLVQTLYREIDRLEKAAERERGSREQCEQQLEKERERQRGTDGQA